MLIVFNGSLDNPFRPLNLGGREGRSRWGADTNTYTYFGTLAATIKKMLESSVYAEMGFWTPPASVPRWLC